MAYVSVLPQPRESNHLAFLDASTTFFASDIFIQLFLTHYKLFYQKAAFWAFPLESPHHGWCNVKFAKSEVYLQANESNHQATGRAPGGLHHQKMCGAAALPTEWTSPST